MCSLSRGLGKGMSDRPPKSRSLVVTFIIFWIQGSDESEQLPVPAACLPCLLGMAFVPSQGLTFVTAKVVGFGLWLQLGKVSRILAFCHLRSLLQMRVTCKSAIRNHWVGVAGEPRTALITVHQTLFLSPRF